MKTSEQINELSTSVIKLQSELSNIGKDSSGYGYKYTSLDKLLEYLRPLMSKNNLGIIQTPTNEDNKIGVTTRLIHTSGQYIEDTLLMDKSSLAKMNDYQVAGSIISYFRRYAISSILGIASDDDIDANIKPIGEKQPMQNDTITQEQVLELEELIKKSKADREKYLIAIGVKKLEDLPMRNFASAVKALNAKIEKNKKEEKQK